MKIGNSLMRSNLKYKEETMQRLLDIINADSGEKKIRFEAVSCINHLLEEGFWWRYWSLSIAQARLFPVILQIIILHYEGDVTMQIVAPTDGIVFFAHNEPLVLENTVVFKVIRRLHK